MKHIALLCLLYLSVDIAELCKWHSYGQTRSFGLVLFAKKAFYVHKDSPEAKNRMKNGQKKTSKSVFLLAPPASWLSLNPNELAHNLFIYFHIYWQYAISFSLTWFFLSTEFACFVAREILSQVINSIPWVRCASGNVFF